MNYKQLLPTLLLGLSLLVNIGCPAAVLIGGGAAAGGGTLAYVKGELKSTEEVSLTRAYEAAQLTMDDLEFQIISKGKDFFDAEINASGAGGKEIRLTLKRISDNLTDIGIRIGTFGDRALSEQILERIKKRF